MNGSKKPKHPSLRQRLFAVWFRHLRVYGQHLVSNAFPPFLEPLIFLGGIGLGLGKLINDPVGGMPYIQFLSIGLLVTTAMWTSAFECTFGTFIRLEYQKVYDGMLAAPLTADNLIVGEILWGATKGFLFSGAVLCVMIPFGLAPLPQALVAPLFGLATAAMFASLGLLVTSFVKTINHFNFFMTGCISPMFFFSGVVFPIDNLPAALHPVAEALPLTHSVRIMRFMVRNQWSNVVLWDTFYIIAFISVVSYFAVRRLRHRLIQ